MPATSSFTITNQYSNVLTTGTGGTLTDSFNDGPTYNFAAGTAANQIDSPWSHVNTGLTSSENFTLSALVGPGSATTSLARVRKLFIHNQATTDGNTITIAPGSMHPWAAGFAAAVTIPAGGCFCLMAPNTTGLVVTSGIADQITVTCTAGMVPYKLQIEGCSV